MDKTEIGIVIPCKNEEEYIADMLASVANQTLVTPETPIIISDANSDDNTREVINRMKEKHRLNIQVIDGGLPAVGRNNGAKVLNAEYLLFLDADIKLAEPGAIEKALQVVRNKNLDMAVTKIKCENGNIIDSVFWPIFNILVKYKLFGPIATGMFLMVRNDKFREIGGFNEKMILGDDVELSKQVSRGKFSVAPTFIHITNRRFREYGYTKTIIKYLQVFFFRSYRLNGNNDYFSIRFRKKTRNSAPVEQLADRLVETPVENQ